MVAMDAMLTRRRDHQRLPLLTLLQMRPLIDIRQILRHNQMETMGTTTYTHNIIHIFSIRRLLLV